MRQREIETVMNLPACAGVEREIYGWKGDLEELGRQPMGFDFREAKSNHFLGNSGARRCLCLKKSNVTVVWKVDGVETREYCPTMTFRRTRHEVGTGKGDVYLMEHRSG